MAGTLTVQNIQGPASGANANKIILPSGQTLDAAALEVAQLTGPSGASLINIVDHSANPPSWSYTNSSATGSIIWSHTFTVAKRSLLFCSTFGHCYNVGGNTIVAIDIDGDAPALQYPTYVNQAYYTNTANNNIWAFFSNSRHKEVAAGSHTVGIKVGGDGGTHTNYINGFGLSIYALEVL